MRRASFYKFIFHPYTWICADLQRENSCRNWHVHSRLKRLRKHCVFSPNQTACLSVNTLKHRLFYGEWLHPSQINSLYFHRTYGGWKPPPFSEYQPQWESVKQTGQQHLKWIFWGNGVESFCFKGEKILFKEGHMCHCLRSPQNVGVLPI